MSFQRRNLDIQSNQLDSWTNYELAKIIKTLEIDRPTIEGNIMLTKSDIELILKSMTYHDKKPCIDNDEIFSDLFPNETTTVVSSTTVRIYMGCGSSSVGTKKSSIGIKSTTSAPKVMSTIDKMKTIQWQSLSSHEFLQLKEEVFNKANNLFQTGLTSNDKELSKRFMQDAIRYGHVGTRITSHYHQPLPVASRLETTKIQLSTSTFGRGDILVIPNLYLSSPFHEPECLSLHERTLRLKGNNSLRGTLTRKSVADCRSTPQPPSGWNDTTGLVSLLRTNK
jgi:hypothetical protein